MTALKEQIEALLALNAKGAVSHPVPGLAVELLTRASHFIASPASIELSLIQGNFVYRTGDKVLGVFQSLDVLEQFLTQETYKAAGEVYIDIVALDDCDAETVTHLVARQLMGYATSYEEWQLFTGREFPWLEYWFDAISLYRADIEERLKREREIYG